ncbi:GNAT family N-acetyltransferase [Halorubrum sp. Boch-26]|uniref:GNAT family N-acetyltransferase n=1 Tax=Halorubrum sp. Boch-26 TaxID=2994426 RepID=UPI0024693666|nr:GNAT family N-acetyltransferase [Halorubrum sp. Boch-26]
MEIRRLPPVDDALRRYAAELWLPYHRELAERVDAREQNCGELRLDVAVDNERALAFYEKQGFEAYRKQLTRSVE